MQRVVTHYVLLAVALAFGGVAISEYRMYQQPGASTGVDFVGIPWQSIVSALISAVSTYIAQARIPLQPPPADAGSLPPADLPPSGGSDCHALEMQCVSRLASIYAMDADKEAADLLMQLCVKRHEQRGET